MRTWLRLCLPLLLAACLPLTVAWAAAPDALVGIWLTDEGDSKVQIAAGPGGAYAGKVVWLKDAAGKDGQPLRDANNDDAALRARPIMGLEILSGFKAAADGGWTGGTVYSPRGGKSYPAELSLAPDGRLAVKVKAGIVNRTLYWTR